MSDENTDGRDAAGDIWGVVGMMHDAGLGALEGAAEVAKHHPAARAAKLASIGCEVLFAGILGTVY